MNGHYAIAIDGPSGAGKSSLARACASAFGFLYVDTGAIYRTVGLAAWRRGLDRRDENVIAAMLPELKKLVPGVSGRATSEMYKEKLGTLIIKRYAKKLFLPACSVYDAFKKEARELYFDQLKRTHFSYGTDAWWCDSSEPLIIHPERMASLTSCASCSVISGGENGTFIYVEFINYLAFQTR